MAVMPTTMTVTVRADTRDFEREIDRLIHSLNELSYAVATTHAEITRMSRALWPMLPWYRRLWLTMRRKGW